MADMIKCPVCGADNPSTQKICQKCQSPLTGSSFTPGQAPTPQDTGKLEPVLPQWLKDARDSARQAEPPTQVSQPQMPPQQPPASNMDFLAGLQSQAGDDDEEDVPEWLANITGGAQKPSKVDPITETSGARWVEMGKKDDFAIQDTPANDTSEMPSWLADLQTPEPKADEKDELTDWFRSSSQPEVPQATTFDTPSSNETPDWLRSMQAEANASQQEQASDLFASSTPSSDTPDWLSQLGSEEQSATQAESSASSASSFETPDWLSQLGKEDQAAPQAEVSTPSASSFETPDWLSQLGKDDQSAPQAGASASSASSFETPDWLSQLGKDDQSAPPAGASASSASSFETPDWLSQLGKEDQVAPQTGTAASSADAFETPDWLYGLGGFEEGTPSVENAAFAESAAAGVEAKESSEELPNWLKKPEDVKKSDTAPAWLKNEPADKPSSETPAWLAPDDTLRITEVKGEEGLSEEAPAGDDVFGDVPDWLKAAAPTSSIFDEPSAQPAASDPGLEMPTWLGAARPVEMPKADEPADEMSSAFESAPAFTPDVSDNGNVDSLFTDMPDWLSNAIEPSSSTPTPITSGDALSPSELPSWVEAMRPLEPTPVRTPSATSDQPLESRGALAGLPGVLPLGTGFAPTSKPKAYSIKLNASEEQLKNAGILEQLLAGETAPEPLESDRSLGSSRVLRWVLAFIFLAVTLTTSILRTQFFSTPRAVPNEISFAKAILEAIPEGAPVLVAFDYEPSRVGEMESVAMPVLDNLMLLKHPYLTFVSSNENGSMLAERLLSGPLAERNYQSGVTYQNLGYLPGGQLGVRAFAQNPAESMNVEISLAPAWTSGPGWGNEVTLNDFAAILLITDSADAARAWIEQTQDIRSAFPIPFIVVSSAQAAPMIQPYYDSGQVNGMVSGLYGGAIYEGQYNRPGVARNYWDAYSIGLLIAMSFVLGGGFLNLAFGMRDRAAKREAK
ncbi:MAG: hypothetical protein JNK32_02525 [Anaerolineales bacterium]|nr:hypothetical protein [Anaerolineales bacterium]